MGVATLTELQWVKPGLYAPWLTSEHGSDAYQSLKSRSAHTCLVFSSLAGNFSQYMASTTCFPGAAPYLCSSSEMQYSVYPVPISSPQPFPSRRDCVQSQRTTQAGYQLQGLPCFEGLRVWWELEPSTFLINWRVQRALLKRRKRLIYAGVRRER